MELRQCTVVDWDLLQHESNMSSMANWCACVFLRGHCISMATSSSMDTYKVKTRYVTTVYIAHSSSIQLFIPEGAMQFPHTIRQFLNISATNCKYTVLH